MTLLPSNPLHGSSNISKRRQKPIFLDRFSVDEAAPAATPHTADIGTATILQTGGNRVSISGGRLHMVGNGTLSQTQFTPGTINRVAGRAIMWTQRVPSGLNVMIGGMTNNAWNRSNNFLLGGNAIAGGFRVPSTGGVDEHLMVVLRTVGCFYLKWVDGFWCLEVVDPQGSSATENVNFRVEANGVEYLFDNIKVLDLKGPWKDDYAWAIQRIETNSAGDTIDAGADGIIEQTVTVATGQTYELSIRRTDANNRLVLRLSQAGSTAKLIKIQAGVETELASSAQTLNNAQTYRFQIKTVGSRIETAIDGSRRHDVTETFNQTVRGGHASHAGTNLTSWLRQVAAVPPPFL